MDLLRVGRLLIRIPFVRFPLEPIRVQVSGLYFFWVSKSNEIEIIFSCCCKELKKEKKGNFYFFQSVSRLVYSFVRPEEAHYIVGTLP